MEGQVTNDTSSNKSSHELLTKAIKNLLLKTEEWLRNSQKEIHTTAKAKVQGKRNLFLSDSACVNHGKEINRTRESN